MTRLPEPVATAQEAALAARVQKLERINAALMAHVERATDQHSGAYSMFQTAIMLEGRVRARTEELTSLMHSLERSNTALKAAKEEAEQANRSKTKFLAAASHDLLQPLNAALLSSSSLADLPLSGEAREVADQVMRGLKTIEELIKTLLDISKLDAGVVHPVKKAVRLAGVFAHIEESFRPLTERKELRFIVRCPDLFVDTDEGLLQRVVQNLVSNAVRYTPEGGILLAARRRRDGTCRIDVVDTGCGIPERERDAVFEEFYRGRQSVDAEAGLGLGLSIVRRIAIALDLDLRLASRVGHGTHFRLSMPLCVGDAEHGAQPGRETSLHADAHVIVIENDPATLIALSRLLQSWGLTVSAHSGLDEWIGTKDRRIPDLLIVDYHLNDGAIGVDAVAEIRNRTRQTLPAVVMTADHSAAVEELVCASACDLLLKPVKPAQLRSLLSYVVRPQTEAAAAR